MVASWRWHILVLVGLALPALIVFAPVLFAGRVFAGGDALVQFYPALSFFSAAMHRGQPWLWTPGVMTGFPLAASLVGGFFSPLTQLAFRLLDVFTAYHWLIAIDFILTGWFMYALARRIGISRPGAVLAGLILPWSTAYVSFGSNITVANGYWLLPLLLWLVKFIRDESGSMRRAFAIMMGGVGVGLTFLAAHLQWPLQALAATVIWAAVLDIRAWRKTHRLYPTALMGFAMMCTLGVLIAWPQLRLATRFASLSAREGGLSISEAFSGGLTPLDVGSYLLPRLNVPFVSAAPEFLYVGALPLLLLLMSWVVPKREHLVFFRWLFVGTFVASFQYSPVFLLVHWLPGFASLRVPSRWMYVGNMAIAILAAYAFEYLSTDVGRAQLAGFVRRILTWTGGVLVFLAVWNVVWLVGAQAITAAITRYFDTHLYRHTTQLPIEHYHAVIRQSLETLWSGTTAGSGGFIFGVVMLVAAVGVAYWFTRGSFSRAQFVSATMGLVAVNLIANPLIGRLATVPMRALTDTPHIVELIRARESGGEPFRVFGFLTGFTVYDQLDARFGYDPNDNLQLERELLTANLQLLYGLDGLDAYENLMDRRSARLLGYLGSNRSTFGENLATEHLTLADKQVRFLARLPLLAACNVRYIVSAYALEHPDLKEVARVSVGAHAVPLILYENRAARPRWYLAGTTAVVPTAPEAQSWDRFRVQMAQSPSVDLIECDTCQMRSGQAIEPVSVVTAEPTAYTFRTVSSAPRWFVFGQNMLPGWRATIDGHVVPIHRANFLNQAVAVPAGRHEVVFTFNPFRSF